MGKYLIIAVLISIIVPIIVSAYYEIRHKKHRDITDRIETVIKLNKMSRDGELEEWIFDYIAKDDPFLQSLKSKYFDKETGIEP